MNTLLNSENIDNFQKSVAENDCNSLARKTFTYAVRYNEYYNIIKDYTSKHSIFDNIIIVQLHPSAENGYPHTRAENVICLPNTATFPSLVTTLFHEAIHIHQRRYKELWKSFLGKHDWNEVYDIPERWRIRCRMNPDTILQPFWSFENRYVPLPMFLRPHDPVFDQIKVMWYDLETGLLDHEPPQSFITKYGTNRQSEHPYEIYAVIMESLGPITEGHIYNFLSKV